MRVKIYYLLMTKDGRVVTSDKTFDSWDEADDWGLQQRKNNPNFLKFTAYEEGGKFYDRGSVAYRNSGAVSEISVNTSGSEAK